MTRITIFKETITIHLVKGDGYRLVDFQGLTKQPNVEETINCIGCLALGTVDALMSEQDNARPRMARRESDRIIFVCDGRKELCRRLYGDPKCDVYPTETLALL